MAENFTLAEVSSEVITSINTNFTEIEDAINAKAELNGDSTERFKVLDAVELTEAVNKRQLDNSMATINNSITVINSDINDLETTVASINYGFPNYSNGVSKTWGTTHTAECNGWLIGNFNQTSSANYPYLNINGIPEVIVYAGNITCTMKLPPIPINQGDTYKGDGGSSCSLTFYPIG